jgi:hypothetical protein
VAQGDIVSVLTTEVARALAPLSDALASLSAFQSFMTELGWTASSIPPPIQALTTPLSQLVSDLGLVESGSATATTYTNLLNDISSVITAVDALASNAASFPAAFLAANANFLNTFPEQLLDYLLITCLQSYHPGIGYFLETIGLTRTAYVAGTLPQPNFLQRQVAWSDIPLLISNPVQLFQHAYQWGTAQFDARTLLGNLRSFLVSLGVPANLPTLPTASARVLENNATVVGNPVRKVVEVELFAQEASGAELRAGVRLMALPAAGASLPGLALMPYIDGQVGESFAVTSNLTFTVTASLDLSGGLGLTVRPGEPLAVVTGFSANPPTGSSATGTLTLGLATTSADNQPIVLFSTDDGTSLQIQHLSGQGGIMASSSYPLDFKIELSLQGGQLTLALDGADGFLSSLLPSGGVRFDFDFGIGWSRSAGLYFTGGASLAVSFPLHCDLGPLELDTIYLALTAGGNGISVQVTVDANGTLGPIAVSVEGVGFAANFTFPRTNPGSGESIVDFAGQFVPPTGLGLSIDAPAVSGGGFIAFNAAQSQYAGGLELTIEALDLKAFGILNTKPEVSFVIIISADFPPIQLGFGFFLAGVGGLLGVNRTMATDPLRAAFRAHTLDDIVFLHGDIVSQAPTLIQGISAIFPPAQGQFIIGPFVTITWSDPALLTAELGFIISLPDPVSIAILGAITVGVPDPDLPLILLNLDVLGTWDSAGKLIEIDASLYDSYVAAFAVGGDAAFRLAYGDSPNFALSVGGLNPQFQPPPKFPTLKRMSISLGSGGNPGLSVQGYFAVTSNSVQFGAAAQLIAEAGGFGVHGAVSFDVLFVLNPFGFVFDLHAELDVLAGGSVVMSIHLDGLLSGTAPWHVHGDASLSILFFSISVNIDATFGQSGGKQNQPTAQVIPPLQAALQDARNWSATLPANAGQVATLAAVPASSTAVIVHPLGEIEFRQSVVPLDLTISKFGNATPSDATLFAVKGVSLNGTTTALNATNTLTSEFADGQFFVLSDQEKISKLSYTPHDSGAVFTSGTILAPFSIETDVVYQTFVENDPVEGPMAGAPYQPYLSTIIALAGTGPSANSPRRQAGPQRYITPGLMSAIGVNGELYTVVSATSFAVRSDIVTTPGNYYSVEEALNQHLATNPGEIQSLQIVAVYETAQAA